MSAPPNILGVIYTRVRRLSEPPRPSLGEQAMGFLRGSTHPKGLCVAWLDSWHQMQIQAGRLSEQESISLARIVVERLCREYPDLLRPAIVKQ